GDSGGLRTLDTSSGVARAIDGPDDRSSVQAILGGAGDGSLITVEHDPEDAAGAGKAPAESRVWLRDPTPLARRGSGGVPGWPQGAAASADGRLVAIGTAGAIHILDVRAMARVGTIATPHITASPLAFLPDGSRLAGGCSDGVVRI